MSPEELKTEVARIDTEFQHIREHEIPVSGISHEDLWNHIAIIEANVLAINAKLDRIMPLVDEAERMLKMTPMQKIRAALK